MFYILKPSTNQKHFFHFDYNKPEKKTPLNTYVKDLHEVGLMYMDVSKDFSTSSIHLPESVSV